MSDPEQGIPSSIHLWWEEATGPLNAEHYPSLARAVLRRVLLWVPVVAIMIVLFQFVLLAIAVHEYQWRPPTGQKVAPKVEDSRNDLENLLGDSLRH